MSPEQDRSIDGVRVALRAASPPAREQLGLPVVVIVERPGVSSRWMNRRFDSGPEVRERLAA
jgi:hypothetical protein